MGQSSCTEVILMILPPPPWLINLLSGKLRAKEGALQVDLENLVVLFFRGIQDRRTGLDAGVVHHDVEPPELAHRCRDQFFQVCDFADICFDSDGLTSKCIDLLFDRGGCLRMSDKVDDNLGALSGQLEDHRFANAAVASSHDCYLAAEKHKKFLSITLPIYHYL